MMARISLGDLLLVSVSYADCFDFPLTDREALLWLPHRKASGLPSLAKSKHLAAASSGNRRYIVLKRRTSLIALRKKRAVWSEKKLRIAKSIATLLSVVPTVELVGITGALATRNAKQADDIDLFIITSARTLWVTRLFATIALDLLGKRRRPNQRSVANSICLNMFMSADALTLPKSEQDLFAAHEVLQMEPLFIRGLVYQKFLRANSWAKRFLPNAWKQTNEQSRVTNYEKQTNPIRQSVIFIFQFIESFVKAIQLWYMHKRRTTEVVTHHMIRFHPKDARVWVRQKLDVRLRRFHVPLDKIFYGR